MKNSYFLRILLLILCSFFIMTARGSQMSSTEIISSDSPSTLITDSNRTDSSTVSSLTEGSTLDSSLSTQSDTTLTDASTTQGSSSEMSTFLLSTTSDVSTTSFLTSTTPDVSTTSFLTSTTQDVSTTPFLTSNTPDVSSTSFLSSTTPVESTTSFLSSSTPGKSTLFLSSNSPDVSTTSFLTSTTPDVSTTSFLTSTTPDESTSSFLSSSTTAKSTSFLSSNSPDVSTTSFLTSTTPDVSTTSFLTSTTPDESTSSFLSSSTTAKSTSFLSSNSPDVSTTSFLTSTTPDVSTTSFLTSTTPDESTSSFLSSSTTAKSTSFLSLTTPDKTTASFLSSTPPDVSSTSFLSSTTPANSTSFLSANSSTTEISTLLSNLTTLSNYQTVTSSLRHVPLTQTPGVTPGNAQVTTISPKISTIEDVQTSTKRETNAVSSTMTIPVTKMTSESRTSSLTTIGGQGTTRIAMTDKETPMSTETATTSTTTRMASISTPTATTGTSVTVDETQTTTYGQPVTSSITTAEKSRVATVPASTLVDGTGTPIKTTTDISTPISTRKTTKLLIPTTDEMTIGSTLPKSTTFGGGVPSTQGVTKTSALIITNKIMKSTRDDKVKTNTMETIETTTPMSSRHATAASLTQSTVANTAEKSTKATTETFTKTTGGATLSLKLPMSTTAGEVGTNLMETMKISTQITVGATSSFKFAKSTTADKVETSAIVTTGTSASATNTTTTALKLPMSTTPDEVGTSIMETTETSTQTTVQATTSLKLPISTTPDKVEMSTMATTATSMPTTISGTTGLKQPVSTTADEVRTSIMETTETSTQTTVGATSGLKLPISTTADKVETSTIAITATSTPTTNTATTGLKLPMSTTADEVRTSIMETTETSTQTTVGATSGLKLPISTTADKVETSTIVTTVNSMPTTITGSTGLKQPMSTTADEVGTSVMETTETSTQTTVGATTSFKLPMSTTSDEVKTSTTEATETATPTSAGATKSLKLPWTTTADKVKTITMPTTETSTQTIVEAFTTLKLPMSTTADKVETSTTATTETSSPTTVGATTNLKITMSTTADKGKTRTIATTETSTPTPMVVSSTDVDRIATTKLSTTEMSKPVTTRLTTEIATSLSPWAATVAILPMSTTVNRVTTLTKATTEISKPTTARLTTASSFLKSTVNAMVTQSESLTGSNKLSANITWSTTGSLTSSGKAATKTNSKHQLSSFSVPRSTGTTKMLPISNTVSSRQSDRMSTTKSLPKTSKETIVTVLTTKSSKTSDQPLITTNTTVSPVPSDPCPKDCNGECNGTATTNVCGFCVGGSTSRSINYGKDCAGKCNGTASLDFCGYCVLDSNANDSYFKDCKNICHKPGNKKYWAVRNNETCNECLFPNETSKNLDICGDCNGQNLSCTDCAGTINGTLKNDTCGICGGNSSSCTRLDSFLPNIIPSSPTKINVIGAGFNKVTLVRLLTANNSVINATDWMIKNSSFLQVTVDLNAGIYKLQLKFNANVSIKSTDDLTVDNKTSFNVIGVSPSEFIIGDQVSLKINGSLPSYFKCTFYSSKNISLGFSWSKNNSCSLPNLISSDKLYLAIFLEGSDDPLKTLQHVTAFAPKPSVSLCRFGDTGAEIEIIFQQKIDTSKLSSCDQIFNDTSILGNGAKCIWRSLRFLTIIIGQGSNLIIPGSNLTFKSGAVKQYAEMYASALDESVLVTKPSRSLPIKAIITGPTRLPVCGTVLFSGTKSTGSGGRDLVYNWTLDTLGGGQNTFEVNTTNLNEGNKYSLVLTVTNYISDSNTSTLEIVRENQAIPIVYITSNVNTNNVQVADTFHLQANVILPPCLSTELTYLWSANSSKGPVILDSKWASLNRYRVKKNSLPGGSVVIFTVRVSRKDNATIFSESSIEVTMKESPLQTLIRGGAVRTIGVDSAKDLVLDATMSYDPDFEGDSDPNLKFEWSCFQKAESGPKFICYIDSLPFSNLSSRTSPLIKLAPKKLLANTKYEFEVSVYKGSRKTSAKTVIEVKEGDPPEAELEPLPRGGLVIPTGPLWLRSYIHSSTPVTVEWNTLDTGNAAEGYLNLSDTSNLLEPTITVNTTENGKYFSIIVIKPGILQKGMKYTVRVTVKNSASPQVGTAETTFSVLTGITSCELNVPTSYTHLESIKLTAERCTTDNSAYPLTYQFFTEQEKGNRFPLSIKSTNPQANIRGPRYNNEQNIIFSVEVCNSFTVCVRIRSSSVKILLLKNDDLVKVKEKIINQVDEYVKTKNYYKAILTLISVVNIQISNRRRKRAVVPAQVTDQITAKALSLVEQSLSVTPSLNDADNLGQIISQLDDKGINNTDLKSLFGYIITLMTTYKDQQTTLPTKLVETIFAKAFTASKRDGFSIDIIRQLLSELQSFSGKFTQPYSFSTSQGYVSSVFSVFGTKVKMPNSNEITLDMGTEIRDRYRNWKCETNRNCQGATIRVLSYKDAQETFPINSTTLKIQSDIVDIGIYNPNTGNGIKVSNLTDKINFEMKIKTAGSKMKYYCLYWDSKQKQWVQIAEAVVNETMSTGICSSSHLSMFVLVSKQSASIGSEEKEEDAGNSVLMGAIAGGILGLIFVAILAMALWKYFKDRSNRVRPFNDNETVTVTETEA